MTTNHVFISYSDGFPVYFIASNTKIRFISKGLIMQGDKVTLINKFYSINNNAPLHGEEDGIEYYSMPKEGNKVKGAILNSIRVIRLIKSLKETDKRNIVYVGAGNFFVLATIMIFARIFGYKVALIQEEFQAGLDLPLLHKINGYLHSFCLGYLADAILPISEYLTKVCSRFHKPMFKLPICADFHNINLPSYKSDNKYFLYCASAVYHRAFDFVLDSFEIVTKTHPDAFLHLILSGKQCFIDEDREKVEQRGLDSKVVIMSQLKYDTLLSEYGNSCGLLIPLFNDNIGDVARFSQKISEYLSTRRPVISTDVGEVSFYFKDKINMLIAEEVEPNCFAEKMTYVLNNPFEADRIGKEGFDYGASLFDYRIITKKLSDFMDNTFVD